MSNYIFKLTNALSDENPLLLRIYGTGGDTFFDREMEMRFFQMLSDLKYGIHLYCVFEGGRLERWCPGFEPLTWLEMRDPDVMAVVARKTAELHNIPVDVEKDKRYFFERLHRYAATAQELCTGPQFANADLSLLHAEIDEMERLFWETPVDILFGHHDLQHCNILKHPDGRMMVVDFEYSCVLPTTFDLANHFVEWQYDYMDADSQLHRPERYPTVPQQTHFVREYLRARHQREPSDEEVESFRLAVQKHSTLPHMHWCLWALLEVALAPAIEYGYWAYFEDRWAVYKRVMKEQYGRDALPVFPKLA